MIFAGVSTQIFLQNFRDIRQLAHGKNMPGEYASNDRSQQSNQHDPLPNRIIVTYQRGHKCLAASQHGCRNREIRIPKHHDE